MHVHYYRTLEFSNLRNEVLAFGDTEGKVGFYDVFRGRETFSGEEHDGAVTSISFGFRMLLSASVDNTGLYIYKKANFFRVFMANAVTAVKLWCTRSLKNMYTLDAGSRVYSVCPNNAHEYMIAYSTRGSYIHTP